MSDNNLGASARFGTEVQQSIADNQRRAHSAESGQLNKCTIVVLTTLDANGRFSYMSADEQLHEKQIEGKVIDRLPNLLAHTAGVSTDPNSAAYILHPNNGVPTRIDERIKVGEGTAVIVSYTVNKAVSEMHGSLSLAMFGAVDADLFDSAAAYGIHAIAVLEENKAPDFIRALAQKVESLNTVNISSIDETEGALDEAVINFAELPGNPVTVLTGAVRTFIMQTISGEVFAAIPNNGEMNVKHNSTIAPVDLSEDFDEGDEVIDQQGSEEEQPSGTDLFGYKAETLDTDQMSEALIALNYDVSEMDEDGIRESFETEQSIWLAKGDDAEDAEDEEEDSEEEDDFDAVQYLASLLVNEELDRDGLKVLIRSQDLKVMKSDTVETLTAKLLELVEGATEQEMVELLTTFVGALQEREIECPNMLAAISDEDDSEEEDEEESDSEEEEDDSEEEEEEEDDAEEGDESSEEDEEEDDIQARIDAVTDPLDYFQFAGGSLTSEQRIAAVEAMGEKVEGLTIVQIMKAFQRIQSQVGELEIGGQDDDNEDSSDADQVRALLSQYDEGTVQHVAENLGILVDECETVDDMIEAILEGGSEDDYAAVEAIAELHGVETDLDIGSMEWEEALMLVLPAFLDQDDVESYEEGDNAADVEDEAEEEAAADSESESDNNNLKFLKSIDNTNSVGPMLSVEMDRTVVINFTLTDGSTYREIESELADIEGINYRFPHNLGKQGAAQGSMHVPAQTVIDILDRAGTTRFLADPKTFEVGPWAESLELTLAEELNNSLYAGRIAEGADPTEAGIVVGDFIDEDELAEAEELGHIDASQFEELRGDHLPISSLYNAHVRVRPVQVDNQYLALNTVVLNIAVPGFWGNLDAEKIQRLIQACVNRVINLADSVEGVKVYAAFTFESAALLNNESLFTALSAMRELDNDVQSYSAADAVNFDEAEDIIEAASALDDRDLPFTILASGLASATFENGGDLTVLVPCSSEEEVEDEEDEQEGDDE